MGIPVICALSLGFWGSLVDLDSGFILGPYSYGQICRVLFSTLLYPLSPVLFLLALEPLALALHADRNVTGIPYAGHEFKLSLFADDALLTLLPFPTCYAS